VISGGGENWDAQCWGLSPFLKKKEQGCSRKVKEGGHKKRLEEGSKGGENASSHTRRTARDREAIAAPH